MIKFTSYQIFSSSLDTLQETSKDTSNSDEIQYLTDSKIQVINFDKVKTIYANNLHLSDECATSIDAVFDVNNKIYFVEFKNGKIKKNELKNKARDSLLIFLDIINKNLSYARERIIYIVVYNINKNSNHDKNRYSDINFSYHRLFIAKTISAKAKEEFIRFGLEKFRKIFFNDVYTLCEEEFTLYLQNLFPLCKIEK